MNLRTHCQGFFMIFLFTVIAAQTSSAKHRYLFLSAKGAGTAVCDAYLKRLNTTQFVKSPWCGIPEDTSVPGFSRLNKEMLSSDEIVSLMPRIFWFTLVQDQSIEKPDYGTEEFIRGLVPDSLQAWRYSPRISVGNDSKYDNVIVWQGYGANTVNSGCGQVVSQGGAQGEEAREYSTQLAYVLTPDNHAIDVNRTRELFGHPAGYTNTGGLRRKQFLELGWALGMFRYQNTNYVEAFYSENGGDFYGVGRGKSSENIEKRLAVTRRLHGTTSLVCEFVMHVSGKDDLLGPE